MNSAKIVNLVADKIVAGTGFFKILFKDLTDILIEKNKTDSSKENLVLKLDKGNTLTIPYTLPERYKENKTLKPIYYLLKPFVGNTINSNT